MADVAERMPSAAAAAKSETPDRKKVATRALFVLRRAVDGTPFEEDDTTTAIETLLEHFDYAPGDDEDESAVEVDEGELDEALARARLGELFDCAIHLGRALPGKYRGIADALERELERGPVKLTIERTDLLKALDPAVKVIQRRNTIPILNNIRIAAESGEIAVTATDLDIEIRSSAAAEIDVAGAVTVPADLLHDLVRRMPDGSQIGFALEEDTRLSMRCGRSHSRLPTLPAGDYPDIAPGEMTHRFDLPGEVLSSLLRDTAFAASTETTTYICGVHWHQAQGEEGPELAAVATDGTRMLARRVVPLPTGANGFRAVTIPTKAVNEIARLVDKEKSEVAIALSETKIRVIIGQTLLTSSLIVGGFPDYERAVPKETPNEITVEAAPLLAAIERVAIIADREHVRATVFSFDDRRVTLTMANSASGDLREEVACDFEGEPFSIGYDHRLLTKLLAVVGGDTVLMRIGGENNPNTIFSSHAGSDMYALLARIKG